ncbi:similar to Saccharomyces cerevisiae YLR130C ZRT2 Low-affinity zinc transporter of the plasma membrane [Maudiozyma saulgeensis]|uniref:Similar to Saccharomyces cerevisiae YLR130C ZRT2 Low-affinity zinc transporter of the plasma membrane n=1 Tax=Maudiozyma saulgeensis TaxID=1789683 RepID=A0A1X7R5Y6_9SACH|nr:similar to Saccharomyces cerevisiae YLR130C ZRT2 Low-affinity zinc transporter of the plasma membrane [Kazachstania saulgeensis]
MDSTIDQLLTFLNKRDTDSLPTCDTESDYNGSDNLRILAVFMILISSALGSFFPILSSRYSFIKLPQWCFFLAKFFGSGVIVATAFVHLLSPASDALGNECLGGTFAEYPWAFGIALMTLFALFFTEIVSHFFITKAYSDTGLHEHENDDSENENDYSSVEMNNVGEKLEKKTSNDTIEPTDVVQSPSVIPGANHYSHAVDHNDPEQLHGETDDYQKERYATQILAVTILEFGIVFHSVFVGLSLAVAGEEFNTLFIVLIFHQMFEGLGLGTRLAETKWPESKTYTPWIMALGFTLTTPIAVAIGIGVRHSFVPGSRKALISNGVFDAISAGILIYTGLVELMAHEFLFSNQFRGENGFKKMIAAYICMCLGAGLMALLGKWA